MTSSFKKSLYTILGGALICIAVLTSCENFLRGGEIKQEIKDAIAYNNAKEISVLIQPEEGTGSTVPSGNHKAKKGYNFEVSFSENPAYSFIKWKAVTADKAQTPVTDGVVFEEVNSPITKVKISNDTVAIRIIPECAERIAVSGEPTPRYEPLGVSRDRSISVTFTKPLAESSFIFTEEEIPAGAQRKEDENGVWAYTYEGQTYLKNISITNIDDYSIAEHFTKPVVSDKLLTVAVDKTNPIEFNTGEIFKTVKVTLSKDITDTSNVKMSSAKSWNYQITEKTDEQATVNLTSVAAEGSVYLAGTKDYSLGQKITLSFTEDADYQFIKWEYDPQIIYINEPTNLNTTATVLDKTTEENPTQIKAVCAPRLRVTSFAPVNDSANPTVSKNSSIRVTFNQNIPADENNQGQLNNISISMGGTPVKSSFKDPSVNLNEVTFVADNSNMLHVPSGQTKTVSVTIPSDFYYTLQDGTKVYYGGNGISFDYKIDDTTLDKAEVNFIAPTGSGDFTAAKGLNHYSIGQEVSIAFAPKTGWQFNGWTIMCGNEEVPASKISIAKKDALTTTIVIYEAIQGVTVIANLSETLAIQQTGPSAAINPKDSDITIKFNKPLDTACNTSELLKKIKISSDGISLDASYATRTLEGDTITIKNTSNISVQKGSTKIISVTVPADFYYTDGETMVHLEEQSFNFSVSYITNAKTQVTYKVINGENSSELAAAGTIKQSLDDDNALTYEQQYNIGEDISFALDLNSGYQFYGWKILKTDDSLVTNEVYFKEPSNALSINPTLTANKESQIKIQAICYKRPVISSVSPYNSNPATEFEKNEDIILAFDHVIADGTETAIQVAYSVGGFSKSTYYDTYLSSDKKTITLSPKMLLPLNNSYETVTVTVPHNNIYYIAADNRTHITPADEDFTWSFRVNNTTKSKTEVQFVKDGSSTTSNQFVVDGTYLSTGNKHNIYLEQSINLEYPVAEGYEFTGWKVETGPAGYTVSPNTYTKSGKITVKNSANKIFFTLQIDGTNPAKAVLHSYDAISSSGNYGIKISAKSSLKPAVTNVVPAEGLQTTDVPIKLTFNMEMDASKLVYATDKISITNGATKMEDYFEVPVLSENGKELTITPKGVALRDYIASLNAATMNLTVALKTGITVTNDGVSIPLLQNDKTYFTVSYKPEFEKTPPTKISFFATRKQITSQDAESLPSSDKFVLKQVDSMTNAEIKQNRTKGTVYLYGKYSDGDSGVSTVTVTQRRTNTKFKSVPEISELETTVFTKNSTGIEFKTESGGITTFCIPYEITEEDGAILLTVTVADAVGNKAVTTETFSAIKRSTFYMGDPNGDDFSSYKLYNKLQGIGDSVDGDQERSFNLTQFKQGINEFVISFYDGVPAIYGQNIQTTTAVALGFENLTIQMRYTDKNGYERLGTFTANGVSYEHHLVLDVDGYLYGKTMELIITDDMGNVGRKTYSFPSESDFTVYLQDNYIQFECPTSEQVMSYSCREFIRNNYVTTKQPITRSSRTYYPNIRLDYNKTGYDEGDDYIYLGKTTSLSVCRDTLANATLPTVTVPSTSYSLARGNTNEINVTLKINSSSWTSCDKIYVLNDDMKIISDNSDSGLYFAKNATSMTIRCKVDRLHNYNNTFSIYGEKGNLRSSPVTISVPKVTDTQYDTEIPGIMFVMDNSEILSAMNSTYTCDSTGADYRGDNFRLYIKDDWSGPKSGTLTLSDGTTYTLNSSNSYMVDIPVWKLLNEYDSFYCHYVISDNKNNTAEGIWDPQIKSIITCSGTTFDTGTLSLTNAYFYIGQNSGSWTKHSSFTTNAKRTQALPSSKFIKGTGYSSVSYYYSSYNGQIYKPVIYFTGTASSGNYDYIIPNTDNTLLIASDAPVYAQTLVTTRSYEECSTWSAEEWECFHKHIGDKYMTFSSSDHSPQKYTIPVDEIVSGECYCVVVHFANNTTAMSTVKKK